MSASLNWPIILPATALTAAAAYLLVRWAVARRRRALERKRSGAILRRVGSELEQAARIQRDLLPQAPPSLAGFDIDGVNVPCHEVGGDYFDFVPIDADRLAVVVADVSGKGLGAALLMASLRAALRAEIRPELDLRRLADRLNAFVCQSTGSTGFVTGFFAELDRRSREVAFVNAGHVPPFVMDAVGRTSPLGSTGFPLGMFAGSSYDLGTAILGPGDLAVLFTDGIPEGRDGRARDYTELRLERVVRDNRALAAADIRDRVLEDLRGYVCDTQPCDDITLVVVKRTAA